MTQNRSIIAVLISGLINAVLFGAGVAAVLSTPQLEILAVYLVPAVVIIAFLSTPFLAWQIAQHIWEPSEVRHNPN